MFNFGKSNPATNNSTNNQPAGSTFGAATGTAATGTSGFGSGFGASTNNTAGSSLFSGGNKTSTTGSSLFGGTSTASSGFGGFGASTSGAQTTSTFGFGPSASGAPTSATNSSLFGAKPATSQASTGFGTFGASASGTSTSNSLGFGASTSTAQPATGGFFGNTAATSKPSTGFGTFGASTTGASTTGSFGFGANTSSAQASGASAFGTGLSKPASSFGFTLSSAPAGSGTNPAGSTSGFGFGSTGLLGAKTTTTGGFGLNQGAAAPIPRLDPSGLDPWGSMKHFSSIPEAEIAKTSIKKRSIKKPDTSKADTSTSTSKEPKLTEFSYSEPDSQKHASKFSLLQTMTLPNRDYNEDFLDADYHNLLLSGAYFSNETDPVPAELLSEEDSYEDVSSDEEEPQYFLTTPTAYQLNQLTPEQLKRVEGFTVMIPRVGRAQFVQPVDLTSFLPDLQFNLTKCIGMRKGAFVLHSPALELGLRGPIDVTLYKLWVTDPETGFRLADPHHPFYTATLSTLKSTRHTTFLSHDLVLGQWKFIYDLKE